MGENTPLEFRKTASYLPQPEVTWVVEWENLLSLCAEQQTKQYQSVTMSVKHSGRRCIVGGCSNTTQNNVSLHKFPLKDSKLTASWNRFVRIRRADWKEPSQHSAICPFYRFVLRNAICIEIEIWVEDKETTERGVYTIHSAQSKV